MSDNHHELIAALNSSLIGQRYNPVVARNYSTYASGFLNYLEQRGIPIADVIDVQV
jgi:integrase/recombinase XerD